MSELVSHNYLCVEQNGDDNDEVDKKTTRSDRERRAAGEGRGKNEFRLDKNLRFLSLVKKIVSCLVKNDVKSGIM